MGTAWGYVNVGNGNLRPAYIADDGDPRVTYSPRGAGAWVAAPAAIAATWIPHYDETTGWRPFVAPRGMRVVG